MATRTLTDLETRLLDFADAHPDLARATAALRAEFGWRPAAYVMRLHRLIDDPAAVAARPVLVHRLQRVRDEKTTERQSRVFTGSATPSATPSRAAG